jgi:hypothetical protein
MTVGAVMEYYFRLGLGMHGDYGDETTAFPSLVRATGI